MSTSTQEKRQQRKDTQEYKRLQQKGQSWKKWGPYLSDRQWGTVREDYSDDGHPWGDFDYTQSSHRAYRWGEDGILGISDDHQQLCFALALWNGEDEYKGEKCIKERFFGLPGIFGENSGKHKEDVKEYYFYLDNTPTHSYMKALYKYPYKYPYQKLIDENEERNVGQPEYELIDTGCFDEGYFDVMVEYAKNDPDDILIKITVWNQGEENKELNVLPTLWFRNIWSWGKHREYNRENLGLSVAPKDDVGDYLAIKATHPNLEDYYLYCDYSKDIPKSPGEPTLLSLVFTENESKNDDPNHYGKDWINKYVVADDQSAMASKLKYTGTKVSADYVLKLEEKGSNQLPQVIKLRLMNKKLSNGEAFGTEFDRIINDRKKESDEFYEAITLFDIDISEEEKKEEDERTIQRQAFAGMLWSKQYYNFNVKQWLPGDSEQPEERPNSEVRNEKQNGSWTHLDGHDIIVMPDKWEYPYFCVWDTAFHAITLALIDPDFAKEQVKLFTDSRYMKSDGQMPSCEFNLSEGNPPFLAWSAIKVDEIAQDIYGVPSDKQFLKEIFYPLYKHLEWCWYNYRIPRNLRGTRKRNEPQDNGVTQNTRETEYRRKTQDRYLFSYGFLGLDNISVIDRNQFRGNETITIEEVDAASWLAMFCLNLLTILTRLDNQQPKNYQDKARDILEKFILINHEINEVNDNKRISLWNQDENFYYEVLKIFVEKLNLGGNLYLERPLKYHSILGILPLFAVEVFDKKKENNKKTDNQKTDVIQDLKQQLSDRSDNANSILGLFQQYKDFQYLFGKGKEIDIQENGQNLELFLSLVEREKLQKILEKLGDKEEFLSDYGIRSLSRKPEKNRCVVDEMLEIVWPSGSIQKFPIEMEYEPGETKAPVHTGNSNWRGPIWFPLNFLIIESLRKYHQYFNDGLGENFKVSWPSKVEGEDNQEKIDRPKMSLEEVALELSNRLINIFKPQGDNRPFAANNHKLAELFVSPDDNKPLIIFNEYFNGDTGQGHGSSHQGWTTLVANLIYEVAKSKSQQNR